jgi:hypothetical protein
MYSIRPCGALSLHSLQAFGRAVHIMASFRITAPTSTKSRGMDLSPAPTNAPHTHTAVAINNEVKSKHKEQQ